MKTQSASILKLLGKVNKRVIRKLVSPSNIEKENSNWFFIDYSPSEISVNNQFDTLLESANKSLIPGKFIIKLTMVLDQFGNKLDSLPKGFQTIGRLQFDSEIPKAIRNLPTLTTWEYNPTAISIAKHENIKVLYDNILIAELFKKTPIGFTDLFLSYNNSDLKVTQPLFIEILALLFKTDRIIAATILDDLLSKGHIKSNENKELELIADF